MIESKQPHYTTPQSGVINYSGHLEVFATSHLEILGHARKTTSCLAWWFLFQVFHSKFIFLFGNPQQTCKIGLSPFPVIVAHEGSEKIPYGRLNMYMSCHPGMTAMHPVKGDNLVVVVLQFHQSNNKWLFPSWWLVPNPFEKYAEVTMDRFPEWTKHIRNHHLVACNCLEKK